eukprot:scaffold91350_cov35-Tisochrysis_lutea.AAC.2
MRHARVMSHGLLSNKGPLMLTAPRGPAKQLRGRWRLGLSPWPSLPLPRSLHRPWVPLSGPCMPADQEWGVSQLEGRRAGPTPTR